MPQVKIDFNKMTKAGLKSVITKFEKKGMKVADVDAPNRPKRESGFLVKAAKLIFESGQSLLIRVKADGTVFQVKLNNIVLPMKHVDNMNKAIDEIIDHVKGNEAKYIKAKQKRLSRKKLNLDKAPKVSTTQRQRFEQSESRVVELTAESEGLQQKIDANQDVANTKTGQLGDLNSKLIMLQDRGKDLETELNGLKAELEAA